MIVLILIALTVFFYLTYRVINKKICYWEKLKIPYAKPIPILSNYGEYLLMRRSMPEVAQMLCRKFPTVPYFGVFYGTEPTLIVQDPELIKRIVTKDFYYCNGRETSAYTNKEVITQSLFFAHGNRWKVLRQNLTPIFSTSKMKNMFYLIEKCCHALESMLDYEFSRSQVFGVRALMSRFTMDSIGTCAFGVNTKTMDNNYTDNIFTYIGNTLFKDTYYRGFKMYARNIWPAIFYGLGMKSFPTETDIFFHKLLVKVFSERKYKPTGRNDFVDLILNFKKNKYLTSDKTMNITDKDSNLEVNDEFLVGLSMGLFAAGFETSSTILQYTLYELAKSPEVQEKVLTEIDEYLNRYENKLNYECVTELPYVQACIDEAMRLYPVLGVLTREVMEEYTLPCGAVLNKGLRIHIPVYHLHRHPDHFPEPEEFRPDRFYREKNNIKPYTYMPFGEGPRRCIGMRFAKMQMMAGIITIFKKYRVDLAEGTPRKLRFTPTTMITQPSKEIKLKLVKRTD